jgi:hypothetical protein
VIDPLGLALENFDVTGQWRIRDNGNPVDPTGDLYDGTKMDGPVGLRTALLKHADVFTLSFTESLMTYALGRRVEFYDMPAIRQIVRDAAKNEYRLSSFILNVVKSPAFQMSAVEALETTSNTQGGRGDRGEEVFLCLLRNKFSPLAPLSPCVFYCATTRARQPRPVSLMHHNRRP